MGLKHIPAAPSGLRSRFVPIVTAAVEMANSRSILASGRRVFPRMESKNPILSYSSPCSILCRASTLASSVGWVEKRFMMEERVRAGTMNSALTGPSTFLRSSVGT